MSYCVALKLTRGLIFMSDTLTNGGVDNISCYPKTFSWGIPGERQIFLSTAGNLATTQSVVSTLSEQTKVSNEREPSILHAPTMFQVARIVSRTLSEVIGDSAPGQQVADSAFSATMILGGQIKGGEMRLYLIYPEGNFIEVSESNPFFQIGETKYGRPILVRAFDAEMEFSDAIRLLMVSFDSTIKAVSGTAFRYPDLRKRQSSNRSCINGCRGRPILSDDIECVGRSSENKPFKAPQLCTRWGLSSTRLEATRTLRYDNTS